MFHGSFWKSLSQARTIECKEHLVMADEVKRDSTSERWSHRTDAHQGTERSSVTERFTRLNSGALVLWTNPTPKLKWRGRRAHFALDLFLFAEIDWFCSFMYGSTTRLFPLESYDMKIAPTLSPRRSTATCPLATVVRLIYSLLQP